MQTQWMAIVQKVKVYKRKASAPLLVKINKELENLVVQYLDDEYLDFSENQIITYARLYTTRYCNSVIFNNKTIQTFQDLIIDIDLFIASTEASHSYQIVPDFNIDLESANVIRKNMIVGEIKKAFKYTKAFIPNKYIPLFFLWIQDNDDRLLIGVHPSIAMRFKICKYRFFLGTFKRYAKGLEKIENDDIKTLNFLIKLADYDNNLLGLMSLIGSENLVKVLVYMSDTQINIPNRTILNRLYAEADDIKVNKSRLDEFVFFCKDKVIQGIKGKGKLDLKKQELTTMIISNYVKDIFSKLDTATDKIMRLVDIRIKNDALRVKDLTRFYKRIQKDMEVQMEFFKGLFG